jgi:hypothetical protein
LTFSCREVVISNRICMLRNDLILGVKSAFDSFKSENESKADLIII